MAFEDEIPMSVVTAFIEEFQDPKGKGRSGVGNQILFQATVVSFNSTTGKVTVLLDGSNISCRVLKELNYAAGDIVWGIQEGNVKLVLGKVVKEDWKDVTFINSWVNFGGGYYPVAYRRETDATIRLRGMAKSGLMNNYMFTLPVGYRPASHCIFPAVSNGAFTIITVELSGSVYVQSLPGTSNTFVCLDGITFPAF